MASVHDLRTSWLKKGPRVPISGPLPKYGVQKHTAVHRTVLNVTSRTQSSIYNISMLYVFIHLNISHKSCVVQNIYVYIYHT